MRKQSSDEISLIKACTNGDQKAFKRVYDTHVGTMYSICLRYMNSSHDAQDTLQEGFIKVFQKITTYAHKGSFEGWMKRIFINTCIEALRKRKLYHSIDELNNEPNQFMALNNQSIDADKLIKLIKKLPHGYRTVFNMYVIDGYSHKEISAALNITENTSKSQLFKARKQLQQWLKGWFE